jgi:hypothetical protein
VDIVLLLPAQKLLEGFLLRADRFGFTAADGCKLSLRGGLSLANLAPLGTWALLAGGDWGPHEERTFRLDVPVGFYFIFKKWVNSCMYNCGGRRQCGLCS